MQIVLPIEDLIDQLRAVVREELASRHAWLDVDGAARYLSLTEGAIRSLVTREQIPFERAPNGRLLFAPDALDDWVRSGARA